MQQMQHMYSFKSNIKIRHNKRRQGYDHFIHISGAHNTQLDDTFRDKEILNVDVVGVTKFPARIVKVHSKRDGPIYYIKIPTSHEKFIRKSMFKRQAISVHLDSWAQTHV